MARSRRSRLYKSDISYARRKELVRSHKDVPCADCGLKFPSCCMDFDHRPGEVKLFTIGQSTGSKGKKLLLAEIAKCDVVCANCHRVRTHLLRTNIHAVQKANRIP